MYEMLKFPKEEEAKIQQLNTEVMQLIEKLPCDSRQKCYLQMAYSMSYLKATDAAFRAGYRFGRITGDEYREIVEEIAKAEQ